MLGYGYRIWHKDLIKFLPNNLLLILYQNLSEYAYNPVVPKRVNPYKYKLNEFNKSHFYNYCCEVFNELSNRKDVDEITEIFLERYNEIIKNFVSDEEKQIGASITHEELFKHWHNDRYLIQCCCELQEMCDYEIINPKCYIEVEKYLMERKNAKD